MPVFFSQFVEAGEPESGDVYVGLKNGVNVQYTFPDVPFVINKGGTGAETAEGARTNLDAQQDISGLAITAATVADDDKVLIQDTSASDALRYVSALSIAELSTGGDVVGPATSTDNAVVRFDGITGELIQNSGVIIDDADAMTGVTEITIGGTNGLNIAPGSDIDADLITVDVTGEPKISWDESDSAFSFSASTIIGPNGSADRTLQGITVDSTLAIAHESQSAFGGLSLSRAETSAARGNFTIYYRSRGSLTLPVTVNDGDTISRTYAAGYDGVDFAVAAEIATEVDGTPGENDMPGRFIIKTTPSGSAIATERLRINNAGLLSLNSSTAAVDTILDEDDMVSDDPNALATQQSIKAYVDAVAGGFDWVVAATDVTVELNKGYISTKVGDAINFSLPTPISVGSVVRFVNYGSANFNILCNTGQTIYFNSDQTTTGAGGVVSSTESKSSIELLAVTTTEWMVISSVGGVFNVN